MKYLSILVFILFSQWAYGQDLVETIADFYELPVNCVKISTIESVSQRAGHMDQQRLFSLFTTPGFYNALQAQETRARNVAQELYDVCPKGDSNCKYYVGQLYNSSRELAKSLLWIDMYEGGKYSAYRWRYEEKKWIRDDAQVRVQASRNYLNSLFCPEGESFEKELLQILYDFLGASESSQ
ncbi:MAG: hypothetical protein R2827_00200 [Bdellovibrionales bacterium]